MKALIEWNPELSIGIEEIDEQHKVLVGLLNRMFEAVVERSDHVVVHEILNELIQYTVIHFAVEESLMRIFNYPEYEIHKAHHEDLKIQVLELQNRLKNSHEPVSMDVLHFLRNWLRKHILIEDHKLGPFFMSKGLESHWSQRSWSGKIWDSIFGK